MDFAEYDTERDDQAGTERIDGMSDARLTDLVRTMQTLQSAQAQPLPDAFLTKPDRKTSVVNTIKSSWFVTTTCTVVPATIVTGCANLAAHQLSDVGAAVTAAVIGAGSLALLVKGASDKWNPAVMASTAGVLALDAAVTLSVTGSGWSEVAAWAIAAAMGLGGRLLYKHRTGLEAAKRDSVRDETAAKVNHLNGRTANEAALYAARVTNEQIKGLILTSQLQKEAAVSDGPDLRNLGYEERALRKAFWDVLGVLLADCEVTPTLTGWKSVIGLPTGLGRDDVRSKWDRIEAAMRVDGRFIVGNGRYSNELSVKFLDSGRRHGVDMRWSEERMPEDRTMVSLGINTETGEQVLIRADERTLICGASGTGKSWAARPLMAHAHITGSLVLIDGKGEEGNIWSDVARVANEPDEIVQVIRELHAEMLRRKGVMKSRKISVWDGDQLTAMVDEGQVILAAIALMSGDEKKELLQQVIELSSLGRSRGVVLWWATQKPTMSGDSAGIHSMVAPNMLQRFSLRVASQQEALTALDDCAHYAPHLIPDSKDMRGHGYLKGYGASLIQTWTMTDDDVRELPVKVWRTGDAVAAATSDEDRVAAYRIQNPGVSQASMSKALGIPRTTLQRMLKETV